MSAVSIEGLAELQDRLGGLAARIRADLMPVLTAAADAMADRASGLAGGRLGDSVTILAGDDTVAIGSGLPYARLRELGFEGSETVKASLREIRQVFGRPVTPHPIAVRSFSRTVNMPARPYLAPALAAVAQDLTDGLTAAVAAAIRS
jgi:phage gpG-like protein